MRIAAILRSPRKRPPSQRRFIFDNPFLCVAIVTGLIFGAMLFDLLSGEAAVAVWRFLGIGFHATANLLARWMPDIPGWLDALMVAVIGLVPYLVLDTVWRYLKPD